jgi:mitochondrial fission protein ELM1
VSTPRSRLSFRPTDEAVKPLALVTPGSERPLEIWAVSDGRIGMENQALGLAEAIARLTPARIVKKHISWTPLYERLPSFLKINTRKGLSPGSDPIAAPWPDLLIAVGRHTMAVSRGVRRWSKGKTFVVQVQNPRWPSDQFDAVIPPRHDKLKGRNVIPVTGSVHRVTPEKIEAEYALFRDLIDPLPHPRVAILIGGTSKAFDLSEERATRLVAEIALAVETEGGSILLTFSRRTPEPARAAMTAKLKRLPGLIWDDQPPNPYFAFLGAADYILATEDSTNMATEAASTGKPVFILKMDGTSEKFSRFHAELEALDAARPWGGSLYRWDYEPIRDTEKAATAVLRLYRDR